MIRGRAETPVELFQETVRKQAAAVMTFRVRSRRGCGSMKVVQNHWGRSHGCGKISWSTQWKSAMDARLAAGIDRGHVSRHRARYLQCGRVVGPRSSAIEIAQSL